MQVIFIFHDFLWTSYFSKQIELPLILCEISHYTKLKVNVFNPKQMAI